MPGFRHFGHPSKALAIAVGTVILLISVWVVFPWLSTDRYESFYSSLADADRDGAITRGWIPDDILPRSSRAIHEVHDLSPSTEWCAFEFAVGDSVNLRKNLKGVDVFPPPVRNIPDPDVPWWPSVLKGNVDVDRIHREGFDLYKIERPANRVMTEVLLFAVDWTKGRGFFYSTYKSEE